MESPVGQAFDSASYWPTNKLELVGHTSVLEDRQPATGVRKPTGTRPAADRSGAFGVGRLLQYVRGWRYRGGVASSTEWESCAGLGDHRSRR
jgi:hypothetical protein